MTSFNRNRLIGGIALVLTGFMFLPALLSPPDKQTNGLAVQVGKTPESAGLFPEVDDSSLIQLESVSNNTQSAVASSSQLEAVSPVQRDKDFKEQVMVPIKLESLDVPVSANKKKMTSMQNVNDKQRWLQVGSFSNLANADKLAIELQQKKYAIKVENINVSGKPYRRVLIGPFNSEQDMRKTLNQVRLDGYTPNIQNK